MVCWRFAVRIQNLFKRRKENQRVNVKELLESNQEGLTISVDMQFEDHFNMDHQ